MHINLAGILCSKKFNSHMILQIFDHFRILLGHSDFFRRVPSHYRLKFVCCGLCSMLEVLVLEICA